MRLTKDIGRPELTERKYKAINTCYYNSPAACADKLGEYENIDESPKHLAKVKRAFDIVKEKQVDVRMFIIYDLENYNRLQKNDYCKLTKAEDDLLKEVLL
jgi:hypothetical protein